MLASDKPSKGGASKIITSAPLPESVLKRRCIALESSNSAGFGGSGPEGMTRRLGTFTSWRKASSDDVLSTGVLDSPAGVAGLEKGARVSVAVGGILNSRMALLKPFLSTGIPKFSCCFGRRRYASIRKVFLP